VTSSSLTPSKVTLLVRVGMAAGGAILAVLMLGPFQALENAMPVSDKVLHAAAFYILANGLFIALPRNRRADIALGLLALAISSEVLQGLVGRDCDVFDMMADGAGIYAAVIPMWVERLRQLTRENPHGDIVSLWQARERRRGPAAASKPLAVPKGSKPWSHAAAPVRRANVRPNGPAV
jgi:VanZ family protein